MGIEFGCIGCRKKMRAPDGSSGRTAKCPLCGTSQRIPAGENDIFPVVGPSLEQAAGPSPPLRPIATVGDESAEAPIVVPATGSMYVECLKAVTYGLSNFSSIVILVLYALVLGVLLAIAAVPLSMCMFIFPGGAMLLAGLAVATNMVLGGFTCGSGLMR